MSQAVLSAEERAMDATRFPRRLMSLGVAATMALLLAVPAASAQGVWRALAPVPSVGDGVEGMQVGRIGNLIVAAYGFDNAVGDTNRTRIYNINADAWSTGAAAPRPVRSEGTAVTKAGTLYAIGGRGPGGVLADVDRYRPATNRWVSLPDMSTPRAGLAAAVVGRAIYAIGGRDSGGGPCSQAPGGELATVERFDIPTQRWSTVARLPRARSDLGAIAHGGKIYVFGGCRVRRDFSIAFLDDVDVYNPRTNRWSTAPADLPTARAAMYGVGQKGGRIYVIGGWAGGGPLGTNEVYKVAADAWGMAAAMLTARAEMGVASGGGRIYTVGGALPAFGASSDANEVFKP
jgi:hypothetical protein